MFSAARAAANRANAQLSTGPTTPEGKERSSLNPLKHGLTSSKLVLPGESEEEYIQLRDNLIRDLRPGTALEHEIAMRVVAAAWRLQRLTRFERGFFASHIESVRNETPGLDPDLAVATLFTDPQHMKKMNLFLRYMNAAHREYDRAFADFRSVQRERAIQEQEIAALHAVARRPASEPKPAGFVSHAPQSVPAEQPLTAMPEPVEPGLSPQHLATDDTAQLAA